MVKLSAKQIEELLDELESTIASDKKIVSVEVSKSSRGEATLIVNHLDPRKYAGPQSVGLGGRSRGKSIDVNVKKSKPIVPELGSPKDLKKAVNFGLSSIYEGMGGTQIGLRNGSWGTLTMSCKGIDITMVINGQIDQRCKLNAPLFISNSHVLWRKNEIISSFGYDIGTTHCVFNLNKRKSLDYGHASWTGNVIPQNYFRVYQANSTAGLKIKKLGKAVLRTTVYKQGARTGWSSGTVLSRVLMRLEGYSGTFRCYKSDYKSAGGDSGSPVIGKYKEDWFWIGVHFASGPYFWSWDTSSGLLPPRSIRRFLQMSIAK